MDVRLRRSCLFVLVLVAVFASGCSRKPKPAVTPTPAPETRAPETTPAEPPQTGTPSTAELRLEDVFFDYDRANLREEARSVLNQNGKVLNENSDATLLLEGHCDERGTVEYNLALGERRANAVKNYLVQYGVDSGRLSTISYGEERAFAEGHDESAWSQNRRVHFVRR